jgi:hypothetical protein
LAEKCDVAFTDAVGGWRSHLAVTLRVGKEGFAVYGLVGNAQG